MSLAARLLTALVVAYRRYLSPALPARCRFYPSCSAYAQEALARHGALRGRAWRSGGSYDAIPSTLAGMTRCLTRSVTVLPM